MCQYLRRDKTQDLPLSVFDVISRRDVDQVAQLDSTIATGNCDHQPDPQTVGTSSPLFIAILPSSMSS